jgi:hypothetical protein
MLQTKAAQNLTLSGVMNLVVDIDQNSLVWRSARPKASLDTRQANTENNIHSCVTSGIRSHDLGVRAVKFIKVLDGTTVLNGSRSYYGNKTKEGEMERKDNTCGRKQELPTKF